MTKEQTRQLGIEFERRIQIIIPTSELIDKLDSDTIYEMLNEYLFEYVKQLHLAADQVQPNTAASGKLSDMAKTLITRKIITPKERSVDSDLFCDAIDLPTDYFLYVRSNSMLDKTYKHRQELQKSISVPNVFIRQQDVSSVIDTNYNHGCIIRNPMVVLESTTSSSPYIKVIHDGYTHLDALDLVYYRVPHKFNVLNFNDEDDSESAVYSYCELPYSCFDELVQGAVQLYLTKYKFFLQSADRNRKQNNEDDKQQ